MSSMTALFDTLLEPCFVINSELGVVYCNETAATMCGVTVRKAQRSKFPDLIQTEEPLDWLSHIHDLKDAAPYKETRFSNSSGDQGKIQITCQPFPPSEEGHPQWVIFMRDVTLEERLQNKYRGELEQKEGYILELQNAKQELENYSKNLEQMVNERTAEIRELNKLMGTLLDSLSQGFFVFDKEGMCHDFSSKACEDVLQGRPNKRPVWEVLRLPEKQVEGFKKWLFTLFADLLPFEDLAPLGPPSYPHSDGKSIKLDYFPLKGETGVEGVVVVASDVTSLVEAQRAAEQERQNALMILNLLNKKQQIGRFVRESLESFKELDAALAAPHAQWDPEEIFRGLHTLKGGSASFNVMTAAHFAHEAESLLAAWKEEPTEQNAQQLRKVYHQLHTEFQLFIDETKRILGASAFSDERLVEMLASEVRSLCQQLDHWAKGQSLADSLRRRYLMEPIQSFFEPYNEIVQKVASLDGKAVQSLRFEGGELAILPESYERLFATFVHAYRNAIDHGIEFPSIRAERGKEEAGLLVTRFIREKDLLRIEIQDDGGGIDPLRIRTRLEAKGISHSHESDEEVIQHVFDSSFSTREQVTEISGRGVGMDAIKSAAEALGGKCRVKSVVGEGTLLTVEVPWIDDSLNLPISKAA